MSTDDSSTHRRRKLHPDPIRAPPRLQSNTNNKQTQTHASKLSGYGPHRTYRHLHHQTSNNDSRNNGGGLIGIFHVQLIEGKNLHRRHYWSALSLGPVKHLGLSCAHGEVSSFASMRLAFWGADDKDGSNGSQDQDDLMKQKSSQSIVSSSTADASQDDAARKQNFLPHLPKHPPPITSTSTDNNTDENDKNNNNSTPLTPFDHQGSLRSSTASIVRSPFVASYHQNASKQSSSATTAQQQEQQLSSLQQQQQYYGSTPRIKNLSAPPRNPTKQSHATASDSTNPSPFPPVKLSNHGTPSSKSRKVPTAAAAASEELNLHYSSTSQPHHYAKEIFKSSTVPNDCNPVWCHHGDDTTNSNNNSDDNNNNNNFHIPLHKENLLIDCLYQQYTRGGFSSLFQGMSSNIYV